MSLCWLGDWSSGGEVKLPSSHQWWDSVSTFWIQSQLSLRAAILDPSHIQGAPSFRLVKLVIMPYSDGKAGESNKGGLGAFCSKPVNWILVTLQLSHSTAVIFWRAGLHILSLNTLWTVTLYPWYLAQCLVVSRCSINVHGINEWGGTCI